MPITNLQLQRFQKYFQIIEEIHTIELGAVNFTDEKLQNFLDGTTSWNTTFAKTSRDWYRCKQRQSYGFTIAFSNNPIRELKTTDQLNEFIQNDMEYELLKGYFNHYIEYFNLNTNVNIKPINTNEWTCSIDESIVHIRINDDIYTLNQKMKFETPRGLVLYILKQKFEINKFEYSCLYLINWLKKNDYQLCYDNGHIYIVDLNEFPKVETRIYLNNEMQSKFRYFKRCGILIAKSSNVEQELALTPMATTIIWIKGRDQAYRKYWYACFKNQFNINNLFDVETDHMFNRNYKSFNQNHP